jgi:hypothetical protein
MSKLWDLVWGKPEIDPTALAQALEEEAQREELDFRTRVLIRDSSNALERYWGEQKWSEWFRRTRAKETIRSIRTEDLGERGFSTIGRRLMDATDPKVIRQFFREVSTVLRTSVRVNVGGSVALILRGYLSRATDDIDVVDEVPKDLREQYSLLDRLQGNFGLRLTHTPSHYLPRGWENRTETLEPFGKLNVGLVDVNDMFLSKLFSGRNKDKDDLRLLLPQLDREVLLDRLHHCCDKLMQEERLRDFAQQNWYILTGEETLPQKK